MNKRGIFISLTAVLILGIIIFVLVFRGEESAQSSSIDIQYAKHKYAADYINDLEKIYLPSLVSISEKYALVGISTNINKEIADLKTNLTYAVMTGFVDNTTTRVMSDNYTLPYLRNRTFAFLPSPIEFENFSFKVVSLEQKDSDIITVNSTVSFSVVSEGVKWANTVNYSTDVYLWGIFSWEEGRLITKKWVGNSSVPCVLETMDGSASCSGVSGLCPLDGCTGIY